MVAVLKLLIPEGARAGGMAREAAHVAFETKSCVMIACTMAYANVVVYSSSAGKRQIFTANHSGHQ